MAPKKCLVKLKVQGEFLKSLPTFASPKPKRVKKIATDEKKPSPSSTSSASKASSPAPEDAPPKINTGPKELSTAGLTIHSINPQYTLDRSGKPCKKWVRSQRLFKSFSGFKVLLKSWEVALDAQEPLDGQEPLEEKKNTLQDIMNPPEVSV